MGTLKQNAVSLYTLFERAMNSLQSPFLLVVRLYWGWQFMEAGWGKLSNIQKVIGFFTSLGIPLPAVNAYFVSGMECVGGALLIIGLFSRPIAALLTFDMIVAYVTADREALFSVFSDPGKFYNATPYTFLFACLLILIFGPGKLALDAVIARRLNKAA
ncbi:MAG: DoxX family protein [Terriglobales bacterium]